jgi:hypothetical protein
MLRAYNVVNPAHLELEHVTIEKEQGAERLILRRGAHMMLYSERGQKVFNLLFAQLGRVAFAMKENETLHPMYVGVFGPQTVVAEANRGPCLVE